MATAGCGDDGPPRPMPQRVFQRAAPRPSEAALSLKDIGAPTPLDPPATGLEDDVQSPQDPMTDGDGSDPLATTNETPADPLADADDVLTSPTGPKMPTEHSHWLSLAQFGERVTVRLNGVWYGDFSGPALRDITMALRPGPNTLTVTYLPQSVDAWLAVHVTEGEHSPPIPDLVAYRVAPRRDADGEDPAARLAPTTRTFRFTAQ